MADRNSLFHEATLLKGGRVYQQHMPIEDQKLLNLLFEYTSVPPSIHFDLIDNMELNAVAFTYKSNEFVGINIGTIYHLSDIFFSITENASDPFSITREGINTDVLSQLKPRLKDPFGDHPKVERIQFGHNTQQAALAYALLFSSIRFTLHHEIAHFMKGHIDFIMLNVPHDGADIQLYERSTGHEKELNRDIRWACEYDADRTALSFLLNDVEKLERLIEPGIDHPFKILANREYSYYVAILSMSVLFFVFGINCKSLDTHSGNHPHPFLRLWITIINAYNQLCSENREANAVMLLSAFTKAQTVLTQIWSELADLKHIRDNYFVTHQDLDEKYKEANSKYLSLWRQFIPIAEQRIKRDMVFRK